jgi:2-hydroxychromene-2-carboxylate isomerase
VYRRLRARPVADASGAPVFDPGCPWTWATSRWITEVAPHRDLEVTWRPCSLTINNRGGEPPAHLPAQLRERILAMRAVTLGAPRVLEAVRATQGEAPIGRLYTEYGRRIHHDDAGTAPGLLAESLSAAGLDPGLAAAAEDEAWDTPIVAAMAEALGYVGEDVGSPILVLDTQPRRGVWGPILSPAPTGQAAVDLWDGLLAVAGTPGFHELKRTRQGPPLLPRP